jgi:LmbE family N-acetylglucosaminyl deacetylase
MSAQRPEDESPVVLAIGAHPDDIEFMMAGTLLLLKEEGAELHMWNLANGSCGTAEHPKEEIIRLRRQEAQAAGAVAGATVYAPIADDLMLLYEPQSLRKVAARVRQIQPDIMLVPSPQDYMEDHQNASRLGVGGAFARGMLNFETDPPEDPWPGQVVIYHALPYGLHDGLRRRIHAGLYVDVAPVLETKREMLAQHRTQKRWLDESQGLNAYLNNMVEMCREVGKMTGRFEHAEGWRRHSHLGFAPEDHDPLREVLGDHCWKDFRYENKLQEL